MKTKMPIPFLVLFCFVLLSAFAAPAGVLTRVANTTLKLPPSPPTQGFTHQNAFGSMTFDNPIAIVSPPGETNRLFVLQKGGKIIVIPDLRSPSKVTFM